MPREPLTRRSLLRLRAVLAGGLVLGIGATATVAAWTDQEHASTTFTAATFSIVGAADGATFTDHPASPGAPLNFQINPTALIPGSVVYAPYSVKTAATSAAGTVRLTADAANGTGLGAYLTYGASTIAGTACTASTFAAGTVVVATGSALSVGAAGSLALAGAGASVVTYCFAVTLPSTAPSAAQGTALNARWIIEATTG